MRKPTARPATTAEKRHPTDLPAYALAALLLAGVGYVAWRTQVQHETLAQVFPFMGGEAPRAGGAAVEVAPDSGDTAGPGRQASPIRPTESAFGAVRKAGPERREMGHRSDEP